MDERIETTTIFEKIDQLDDIKSVRELLNKLKPILTELAYYSLMGDSVLEKWHSNINDQIRREVSNSRQSNQQSSSLSYR